MGLPEKLERLERDLILIVGFVLSWQAGPAALLSFYLSLGNDSKCLDFKSQNAMN